MSQNQFLSAAITAFTILVSSGCTNKEPPLDKTFRIAWESAPRTVDPRYAIDADSQYLAGFIHCSLIKFDPQGKVQNSLASEMKWADSKTLEVKLKSDVQFSDRTPVTAEDVRATFEVFKKDLADPSPLKASFSSLQSVEVIAPHHLKFHLSEPNGEFLNNLSIGILPKSMVEGPRMDPKKAVGCGNFIVDQWAVSHVLLKRNVPNPAKNVQYIRIEIVKDENTRFLKMRNSELDLVKNALSRDQLTKLHEYPNLKFMKATGLNTLYMAFQLEDPLLKQKKVRQAISYAVDRKKIISHLLQGWATEATTILTPTDSYFNQKLQPYSYDPEKAKKLLDQAGFPMTGKQKNEPRFVLKLKTTTNAARMMIAHAIADELAKVGIEVSLESLDWGKFKADVDKGIAQMWILNWIGFKGPDIYKYAFATSSFPPNGANRGKFSNAKVDELLSQANSEVNVVKRKALYDQVQEIILDEAPYLFLWHEDQFAVLNKRVNQFELYADGSLTSVEDVVFSTSEK